MLSHLQEVIYITSLQIGGIFNVMLHVMKCFPFWAEFDIAVVLSYPTLNFPQIFFGVIGRVLCVYLLTSWLMMMQNINNFIF